MLNEFFMKYGDKVFYVCMIIVLCMVAINYCSCSSPTELTPTIYESSYGMGFYITQNQINTKNSDILIETYLKKFHRDCFLKSGILNEILWMGKGGGGHEPYQIIIISDIDTLWISPIYITGYIECERKIINKPFNNELEIIIKKSNTEYPIELYVTTIINH